MENNEKISVALDSCVAIELGSYIINVAGVDEFNKPEDYHIYEVLSKNGYNSKELTNEYSKKIKPRFLTEEYGHGCAMFDKKNGIYPHLEAIAELYDQIVAGNIEVYVTKTVLYEIMGAKEQGGWIIPALYNQSLNSGVIKVIDDAIITRMSCELAKLYCQNGVMERAYDTENDRLIPSNDAYIMAQCSIVGLTCLTWNVKDFIDKKNIKWWRTNGIQAINKQCGLEFDSVGSDRQIPSNALTPDQFIGRYKAYHAKWGNPDEYENKPVVTIPDFDLNRINEAYKVVVEKLEENAKMRGY